MSKKIINIFVLQSGQAMVETLLIIVFVTLFVLAGIQLNLLIIDKLTYNEAAFSSARVAMVSKSNERSLKTNLAAYYLILSQLKFRDSYLLRVSADEKYINVASNSGNIKVLDVTLNYLEHIMCGDFFQFVKLNYLFQKAILRVIPSSDEDYFYKAYPGALRFDE